ncbi:MAG: hypothetical protein ACJAVD_001489 [Porticoccaceae bacterium]|jgi:hypothetical protein
MQNEYAKLLIDVQKKSNIIVTKSRDLRFLKEDIDETAQTSIGYNTLRRLYGFLKITQPSISTLNILAAYLGFKSYASYKFNIINYDEWYFQQNLQRIQSTNKITDKDIEVIRVGLLNINNIVFYAYFFSYFIERYNITVLEELAKKIKLSSFSSNNNLKFATIISLCLYRIEEKKTLKIYKKLIKYDDFRNNVPLLYVDYSNLNGIYAKVLTIVKQQSKKQDDLLFVSLMRFYWKYYSSKEYVQIKIEKPIDFDSFHPVLKGRFYAYLLLKTQKRDKKIEIEIIQYCIKKTNTHNIIWFLEEIIPTLISKKNFDFLTELIDEFYEDIFEIDRWSSKTGQALSLIAMANLNIKKENMTMAELNLSLVEIEKVELSYSSYVALFYYQAKLKITHQNKAEIENKKICTKLENLIEETGFTKFSQSVIDYTYIS